MLRPTQRLEYLGFIVDSSKQAVLIPERKVRAFATLREYILGCKKIVDVKTLQRFQGKCVSLSLAVPVAKLYIRAMSRAIAISSNTGQVKLTDEVRHEISYWRFLDSWSGFVSWRQEKHVRVSLYTDASGTGWGVSSKSPRVSARSETIGRKTRLV